MFTIMCVINLLLINIYIFQAMKKSVTPVLTVGLTCVCVCGQQRLTHPHTGIADWSLESMGR